MGTLVYARLLSPFRRSVRASLSGAQRLDIFCGHNVPMALVLNLHTAMRRHRNWRCRCQHKVCHPRQVQPTTRPSMKRAVYSKVRFCGMLLWPAWPRTQIRDTIQRVVTAAGVPNWRFGPRTVSLEPERRHRSLQPAQMTHSPSRHGRRGMQPTPDACRTALEHRAAHHEWSRRPFSQGTTSSAVPCCFPQNSTAT